MAYSGFNYRVDRLRLKPEEVDLEPLLMIRFPWVYLWDLKYSTPYKIPQTSYLSKSFWGTRFRSGNWNEGNSFFFSNLDAEGLSCWAEALLDCRRNPLRNSQGLILGLWAVDQVFEGWLSKEARKSRQQSSGSCHTVGTSGLEQAGENAGSRRGRQWEEGAFGIRKHRDEVQQRRFLGGERRTNITAGEIWLQCSRAWS